MNAESLEFHNRSALVGWVTAILVVLALAGCGSPTNPLDQASPEVREIVADVNSANQAESYRFTYSPISTVFLACLSIAEQVEGVVDGRQSIFTLSSRQRPGTVYSLDRALLIHRNLIDGFDAPATYARLELSATSDISITSRLEAMLGPSLSALLANGAWPDHPNEVMKALIPRALSVTLTPSNSQLGRAIRIVLDPNRYQTETAAAKGPARPIPPIVDFIVSPEGIVQRMIAQLPEEAGTDTVGDHGEGYSVDYFYDPEINIDAPAPADIVTVAANTLPTEPTAIPCQLDP